MHAPTWGRGRPLYRTLKTRCRGCSRRCGLRAGWVRALARRHCFNPILWCVALLSFGFNPFVTKWIENYLSERFQLVVLDGVESSLLPVISVVPQGSIIGPLLFLIYIDKAANCVSTSNIAMYADDIALYRPISCVSDYTHLQEEIISLCIWISHNHLKLNVAKCCYMTFSRKLSPTLPNTPLTIDDSFPLSRVDDF